MEEDPIILANKQKYIDFLKTFSRVMFEDPDIIMLDYFLSKQFPLKYLLDLEESQIMEDMKLDVKTINSALISICKSYIILKNEHNLKGEKGGNERAFSRNKKHYYCLNPKMIEDLDDLMKKVKIDESSLPEYECPNCKIQYASQDLIYQINITDSLDKFFCKKVTCKAWLSRLSNEMTQNHITQTKRNKQIFEEQLLSKLNDLKGVAWPWPSKNSIFISRLRGEGNASSSNIRNNNANNNNDDKSEEENEKIDILKPSSKIKSLIKRTNLNFQFEPVIKKLKQMNPNLFIALNCERKDRNEEIICSHFPQNRRKFKNLSDLQYDEIFKKRKMK